MVYEPVSVTEYNGGTLYEFETELNAVLEAKFKMDISRYGSAVANPEKRQSTL